jgi:ribosomal protein S14
MKKLLEKDKNLRLYQKQIRWNAHLNIKYLVGNNSKVSVVPRCVNTVNRKRFNKLTNFSRQTFLKLIRSGKISGMRKSSW